MGSDQENSLVDEQSSVPSIDTNDTDTINVVLIDEHDVVLSNVALNHDTESVSTEATTEVKEIDILSEAAAKPLPDDIVVVEDTEVAESHVEKEVVSEEPVEPKDNDQKCSDETAKEEDVPVDETVNDDKLPEKAKEEVTSDM